MKKKVITDTEVDEIVNRGSEETPDEDIEKLADWVLQVKEEIDQYLQNEKEKITPKNQKNQ